MKCVYSNTILVSIIVRWTCVLLQLHDIMLWGRGVLRHTNFCPFGVGAYRLLVSIRGPLCKIMERPPHKHWYTGAFFLGRISTYLLLVRPKKKISVFRGTRPYLSKAADPRVVFFKVIFYPKPSANTTFTSFPPIYYEPYY